MTVDLGSSPGVRGAPFTETFMIEMAETLSAWGPRHRIHTLPILAARLRRDPCGW